MKTTNILSFGEARDALKPQFCKSCYRKAALGACPQHEDRIPIPAGEQRCSREAAGTQATAAGSVLAPRPRRSGLHKQFLPRRQERAGRWKITAGFFLKGENLLSGGKAGLQCVSGTPGC